jgi:Iron-containing redox enzyme
MTVLGAPEPPVVGATDLADRLEIALGDPDPTALEGLAGAAASSRRDRFATLLHIYQLSTAPIEDLASSVEYQTHPAVAAIKQRCESDWLLELEALPLPEGIDDSDPVASMRALAARDRLPEIYKWLAHDATWEEIVTFLALEGGPDAGFDDLVAMCQVGLTGSAKLELATNYWDEMGNGDLAAVHTTLHEDLAEAIDLPRLPLSGQPTSALERAALGGLLTTNRWLQPESLGALGLIELQAGPRCRLVLAAFDRCEAPAGAYPFYEVHAEVDPRHGQDWLENAITPIAAEHPEWSPRIVRGAQWRSTVNAAFLRDAARMLRQD